MSKYPEEIVKQAKELIAEQRNTTQRDFVGASEMAIRGAIVSCDFALKGAKKYGAWWTHQREIEQIKSYLESLL